MVRIALGRKTIELVSSPTEIPFSLWLDYNLEVAPKLPKCLSNLADEQRQIVSGTKKEGNIDLLNAFNECQKASAKIELADFYLSEIECLNPFVPLKQLKNLSFGEIEFLRNRLFVEINSYKFAGLDSILEIGGETYVLPNGLPLPFSGAPIQQYIDAMKLIDFYEKLTEKGSEDNFLGLPVIKDISKLLPLAATVWTKQGTEYESSNNILTEKVELFKDAPLSKILDAVFFFINCSTQYRVLTRIVTEAAV